MNFNELIKSRYSVRSFSDKKIEDDKLNALIEAASVAPTACNNQPQRLYVLKSNQAMERLKKVSRFVFGAPSAIIFTANTDEEWKNPFTEQYHTGEIDCSIVCTHVMLQAWELGIGSCWLGYFNPEDVRKEFTIPDNEQIVAILLLGYPAKDSKPASGHFAIRPVGETVKYL